jgi:plastocyanin
VKMRSDIRDLLVAVFALTVLVTAAAPLVAEAVAAATVQFGGNFGLAYSPSRVTVRAGQSVAWQGSFSAHPLISDDGQFPEQTSGTRFTFTFASPGTFRYHCGRHASIMSGEVVVLPVE